jgi:hypothetical protein
MIAEKPFKINGVAIPTPTEYTFDVEDLSSQNTGRTLDGRMHKDVVAVKDTYTCTWKKLSWQDAADLLNAINAKEQFTFTHADPRVPGTFITGEYYVGKRSSVALNLRDDKNTWKDIKFTFIQI